MKKVITIILMLMIWPSMVVAQESALQDIQSIKQKMDMLDKVNFHPTLLPTIMGNMDTIGLSEKQISEFSNWRKNTAPKMVKLMRKIVQERLNFQKNSINRNYTDEQLIAHQQQIFRLHQDLLKLKLKCRKVLTSSFTDEQWDNLLFVIGEEMSLAFN